MLAATQVIVTFGLMGMLAFAPISSANPVVKSSNSQFSLQLTPANTELAETLGVELKRQRELNTLLTQYRHRKKFAHYESELLVQRLHAQGYYNASVQPRLGDTEIVYRIQTGKPFTVERVVVVEQAYSQWLNDANWSTTDTHSKAAAPIAGVNSNKVDNRTEWALPQSIASLQAKPLRANSVLAAQDDLLQHLRRHSCRYNPSVQYDVLLNTEQASAQLALVIEPRPSVNVGDIVIAGLETIDANYVRARLPVTTGQCLHAADIADVRLQLLQLNLLTQVSVSTSPPTPDNRVNLLIDVTERKHRTLSAGVGYQSDEGAGVSVGWVSRNLWGRAQQLRLDARWYEKHQTLSATLTVPHFRRAHQTWTVFSELDNEITDAFESKEARIGSDLSRDYGDGFSARAGLALSVSDVVDLSQSSSSADSPEEATTGNPDTVVMPMDEIDNRNSYSLFSVPLGIEYDRRNNQLNPRKGWWLRSTVEPMWDISDSATQFVKASAVVSGYHTFEALPWPTTVAVKMAVGSITGASQRDIPINQRFFVGGGGSVRGYASQSLGPTNNDEPTGGLSYNEYSVETRWQVSQEWGGVLFLDGGMAYRERAPQPGEELRWGAGVGVRYYSSFAPLRFDIGVPLDPRPDDSDYQLYISIGQSF